MSFNNRPHMQLPGQPPNTTVRWTHQPLSLEHNGFHFSIHENGRVTIVGSPVKDEESGEMVSDEIDVPASLIYKISRYLQDTRKANFIPIGESK